MLGMCTVILEYLMNCLTSGLTRGAVIAFPSEIIKLNMLKFADWPLSRSI